MNGHRMFAALCFALLCSGLFTWQISKHMSHAAPATPISTIVVAAKDLAAGEKLTFASVTPIKVLTSSGSVAGLFSNPESISGRVLLVPVPSGEAIAAPELASADATAGLAATVPKGLRAVSVPINDLASGDANLIKPGNHVDVLVSYRSDVTAAFVSSIVVEDVPVLDGTHKQMEVAEKPPAADTVELLVTPEQAARIAVASSMGKLVLTLRNGTDDELSRGLTQVSLTPVAETHKSSPQQGRVEHVAHSAPGKSTFTVEMLSGGKSVVQTFPGEQP